MVARAGCGAKGVWALTKRPFSSILGARKKKKCRGGTHAIVFYLSAGSSGQGGRPQGPSGASRCAASLSSGTGL